MGYISTAAATSAQLNETSVPSYSMAMAMPLAIRLATVGMVAKYGRPNAM